jgi:hypothetical protein
MTRQKGGHGSSQLLEGDACTTDLGDFFDDAVRNPVEHHLEPTGLFPSDCLYILVGATVNVVLTNRDTPPAQGSPP